MDKNTIIILGSGTSTGIPMLGCHCVVCTSPKEENKRSRSSILFQIKGKNIIVDTTPDLRTQLLRENISEIHGAIITHDHADHIHGIDDLRPLTFKAPIGIFTHKKCAQSLRLKFPYIFNRNPNKKILGGGIPKLLLNEVSDQFNIGAEFFEAATLPHGHTESLSVLHEKFAYIIDCHTITDEWIKKLRQRQLELLIIDCVRYLPHETHLCFDHAIEFIKLINPKRAGLIHMAHEIEHFDLLEKIKLKKLTIDVFPVVDGMKLTY